MSTPKSKKGVQWVECDSCGAAFLDKDAEKHSLNCPTYTENATFFHVKNGCLVGELDFKKNENIKGLSSNEIENLIFMSQSAIQLCGLTIGDWVVMESKELEPIVKKVWPTIERSLTSVLLPKQVIDLHFGEIRSNPTVSLKKLTDSISIAKEIHVKSVGNVRNTVVTQDLMQRLANKYRENIFCVGTKVSVFFFGKIYKFKIRSIKEDSIAGLEGKFVNMRISDRAFFQSTNKTRYILSSEENSKQVKTGDRLLKIGGLSNHITELKQMMKVVLGDDPGFPNFKPSNSVILYGHSGTGKTTLANALMEWSGAHGVTICAPDLYSDSSSNPEEILKRSFDEALENQPAVLLLDEIDLLCPLRSSRISETEKRVASSLLQLLDTLHNKPNTKVFIIATTNKIDNVDSCFRRFGRFERELEIPTPTSKDRKEILEKLLREIKNEMTGEDVEKVALSTHGFVGADLLSLCSRCVTFANENGRRVLVYDDFRRALPHVQPSAMREVQIEIPNVKWSDVAGQEKLQLVLKQAVEWPLKHPESFSRLGIIPPKGVLMYGPPGCSKTMIAKALATESGLNFLSIKGPELFSKWVGESERAVREVFKKARQVAPSVIFFDEIDALGGERSAGSSTSVQERVLAQLLTELDGITPLVDVTILAATNRPDKIDKALLRPGRLDRIFYVPLPNEHTRREIFRLKFRKIPVSDVDVEWLVTRTAGYSGAEVNAVCQEAAMKALEDNIDARVVTIEHFEKALETIAPRTPAYLLKLLA